MSDLEPKLWSLAVEAPLRNALTYSSPEDGTDLVRGQRVIVPLGKRNTKAVVLGPGAENSEFKIRPVQSVDLESPILSDHFLKWLEWVSQYYVHPIGQVIESVFPPLPKTSKLRKSSRPAVVPTLEPQALPELTPQQSEVLKNISTKPEFSVHLLFGVTGSGKTEVYLRLLDQILKSNKTGMVLVPEISLTPQLVQRFARRFGDQVAVLHSQLTDRERTTQWWDIVEGRKKILIGARSALFCPIPDLGIIVVDEEHEPSFKQDEKLKYHGRDSAVMLGKMMNCPVVLGSATPSLETWKNASEGKYHLHRMTHRVENRSLPDVQIINLRESKEDADEQKKKKALYQLPSWLHSDLFLAIEKTLARKEQVALFLNRRGVAPMMTCPACGYVHECPNCDISLTLHGRNHLVCHYCDYHETAKEICPSCKEGEMRPIGVGTEQVENDIQKLFPGARVARADRDEIQNRADLEDLIEKMETREIDILVGTQMIAKGLDFPGLTLVGLVLADVGFNLPDFRSTERSFQLMTQMSGRAGRHIKAGETPGQVFIQTLNPDHPSLTYAIKAEFEAFAEFELQSRQPLFYPPFGRLASFRIQGQHLDRVQEAAEKLAKRAVHLKSKNPNFEGIEVLGPAEAPMAKLRGQFRYHLLLKSKTGKGLTSFCYQIMGQEDWLPAGVRLSVDVDPLHLL